MRIKAKFVQEGDTLVGLDGYVFEDPETGDGYLSYPTTGYGQTSAMPADTVVIAFHDSEGEENYLLVNPNLMIEIDGPERDMEDDDE